MSALVDGINSKLRLSHSPARKPSLFSKPLSKLQISFKHKNEGKRVKSEESCKLFKLQIWALLCCAPLKRLLVGMTENYCNYGVRTSAFLFHSISRGVENEIKSQTFNE